MFKEGVLNDEKVSGHVKWFDIDKGFGFLG